MAFMLDMDRGTAAGHDQSFGSIWGCKASSPEGALHCFRSDLHLDNCRLPLYREYTKTACRRGYA